MNLNGSDRDRAGVRRSPSALAELSRLLTLQSYLPKNGGLIGSGWAQFMAERARPGSALAGGNLPVALQLQQARPVGAIGPGGGSGRQLAATSSPSRWTIPAPGCASCHGPRQPPLPPTSAPPVDDPWTYYPEISRRNGGGWGTSPSRSGDDKRHCEIQESRDNAICRRQVAEDPDDTERVRAVCHASKMKRYKHCLATDQLDEPDLDTYWRQIGEPPIKRWRRPR